MRLSCSFVALVVLASCYHSTDTRPIDGGPTDAGANDASVISHDAGVGSACPMDYDPSSPYPFCQYELHDGWERYCPPTFGSWGYSNWHTSSDGTAALCHNSIPDCNTCLCALGCSTGGPLPPLPGPDLGPPPGPCPMPTTGTAHATCVPGEPGGTLGSCYIFCDSGERCPNGMQCVTGPAGEGTIGGHHLCAWAIGGDRCML